MERTWTEELKRERISIRSMARRIDGHLYRTTQSTTIAADPCCKLILYRNTLDPEFDFEEWEPALFLCRGRNGSYFVQRQYLDESGIENVIEPLVPDDAVNLFDKLPEQLLEFDDAFPELVDNPTRGEDLPNNSVVSEPRFQIAERGPEDLSRQSQEGQKDFFISYNKADSSWAEWIAWQLEAGGKTTVLQAWDFQPGTNFPLKMNEAADHSNHTIAVLSQNYLSSDFTAPEWAAAFASDATGSQRKLIPVRVAPCDLPRLLASIVYIDLVDLGDVDAKRQLLKGVSESRAKPTEEPPFPGPTTSANNEEPHFPGGEPAAQTSATNASRNPSTRGEETLLSQIFQFTTGDYVVVELQDGLRFRLTGLQRAADASALKFQLQGAQVLQGMVDATTPFDGQKLPKISSTVYDPDSDRYHVRTENGYHFELTADEAATMLRTDQL